MDAPLSPLAVDSSLLRRLDDCYAAWFDTLPVRKPSTEWLCCYDGGPQRKVLYHVPSRRLVCVGHNPQPGFLGQPTGARLVEARGALAVMVARLFAEGDRVSCLTPAPEVFDTFKDTAVITTQPLELSSRTSAFRLCVKCNATGSFRGGRCYPCRGLGREEQHGKLRSEDGAPIKLHVPQGARATAVRPAEYTVKCPRWVTPPPMTRGNTRVLCRLATGEFVCIPLDSLTLDREPSTPAELVKDAVEIAATVEVGDARWLTPFGV